MTFVLEAAAPLLMQAFTTTNKVTATVFGMELNAGVETYKVLFQGLLSTAATANYTPGTGVTAFIKSIHMFNTDTIDQRVRVGMKGAGALGSLTSLVWIPAGGWAVFGEQGWNVYNVSGQRVFSVFGIPIPYNGAATSTRLPYNYDTNTASNPSGGNWRLSTNTPHSVADVQTLYLANLDNASVDRSLFFAQLQVAVNRQDLIVTIFQNDTDLDAQRYRVTSIAPNGTTSYTFGLVALRTSSTMPSLSAACKVQFDCMPSQFTPMPPVPMGGSLYGAPGFMVSNMQTLVAITASKLYALPFYVSYPIQVQNINAVLGAAGSGSTNVRFGIYRMRFTRGGTPALGNKLYDQPFTSLLSGSLGLRQVNPALLLPAGYYWLVMATPAFSGSPTLTKLFGLFTDNIGLSAGQTTPTITAEWAITGTDWVTAGALPTEGTAMNAVTGGAINSTFTLSFGTFMWLQYIPLP